MKALLHFLYLEDDPNDASLIQATLEAGGIACVGTRVETRGDFVAALESGGIDLILSDFSLPAFDGLSALKIAHTRWPELPFIVVSGTMGEERAVDALKSGATDYVLKERLVRLAPAVRRAMQDVEERDERRRLEAQVIERQKMDVLGKLAGGVAHDFNNIIGAIMGYSYLIMHELGPDDPLRRYVGEIRHASERAAGLTRQLLVFGRNERVQAVVLDLNDVFREMDAMLRRLIDEHIEMTIVPGIKTGHVKADSGYVGQVLMNLVVNARDAMPNGGKLTITTENITLAASNARSDLVPGNYVMLSVSDTGTGMTDLVKARLFEAFFTTKPKGKGTGLGLATCQTIVQQSGGHIDVLSELGKGTTFKVFFPRVDLPLAVEAKPIETGSLPHGTETLLVVEDESTVRHLAHAVLEAQGYRVLRACNGRDGLRVAREHQGSPIRLVLTDVIMPQMGGKMMVGWLKINHPDLKILFTSGYTDEAIAQDGASEPGVAFLPKPYTPTALIRQVRELLDAPQTQAVKLPN